MKSTAYGLIAILIATLVAFAPTARAEPLDDSCCAWIYGQRESGSSNFCFSASDRSKKHYLQLKDSEGDWRTVATSRPSWFKKQPSVCDDSEFPYDLVWRFTVSELGIQTEGSKYLIQAREKVSGDTHYFTKVVFPSKQAHLDELADMFLDSILSGDVVSGL